MPTRQELMQEAYHRGILSEQQTRLYEEARRRGLIQEPTLPQTPQPILPPEAQMEDIRPQALRIPAQAIAGGGLKAVESIAAAPYDIAGSLGAERMGQFADVVRKFMPNLPPEVEGDHMVQTLVQYGLPAGAVFKLIGRTMIGAPAAIRTVTQILGGGFADFMATDPGQEPLIFEKGKTPTETRLKIGAEGIAVPLAAQVGITGLVAGKRVVGGAAKLVKRTLLPKNYVERTIAEQLQKQAGDIDAVVRNIDDAMQMAEGGFMPTTGTAAAGTALETPGLLQLEKGLVSRGETAEPFIVRKAANQMAVGQQVEDLMQSSVAKNEAAKTQIVKNIQSPLDELEKGMTVAERELTRTQEETTNLIADISGLSGGQATSSEVIDATVRQSLDYHTRIKNSLFAAIDPNNEVVIAKDNMRSALATATLRRSPLDSTPAKLPGSLIAKLKKVLKPVKKGKKEIPLTFGALQDLRPDLSAAITKARAANEGAVVERLGILKDALEREAFILGDAGHPASGRAKKALNYYTAEYVPRFKEAVGDAYRKAVRRGKPWFPTETGRKFISPGSGAKESADQIKFIIQGSPNEDIAKDAIRTHMISDVADLMMAGEGKTSLQRLTSYMGQRRVKETMERFPDIKDEINRFRRAIAHGVEEQSVWGDLVAQHRQAKSFVQSEVNKSAAKFWIDSDPVVAVGKALQSGNPTREVRNLVRIAKQDASGEALKGLQSATSDFFKQNITTTQRIGDVLEVSQAKMTRFLQNPRMRSALEEIYTKGDVAALDTVLDQVGLMNRINKQVVSGSPTAMIQQAQKIVADPRIILASIYGIVKGRGIFTISKWLQSRMGNDPVKMAQSLLQDAFLDPELAKLMLLRETPKTRPIIQHRLWTYMLNNLQFSPPEQHKPGLAYEPL